MARVGRLVAAASHTFPIHSWSFFFDSCCGLGDEQHSQLGRQSTTFWATRQTPNAQDPDDSARRLLPHAVSDPRSFFSFALPLIHERKFVLTALALQTLPASQRHDEAGRRGEEQGVYGHGAAASRLGAYGLAAPLNCTLTTSFDLICIAGVLANEKGWGFKICIARFRMA